MPELKRTATMTSGLEITENTDTELAWEYYSDPLGLTIEGTLRHTNDQGGGWLINCETPGVVISAATLLGTPLPLRDAVTEVEDTIKRTERANAKPDPRDERRKRELDDFFGPTFKLT